LTNCIPALCVCACVGQIIQYEPAWYICIHLEEREERARERERERKRKGGGRETETETEAETKIVSERDGTVREIDCKIRLV
jgi:hypothetical protein